MRDKKEKKIITNSNMDLIYPCEDPDRMMKYDQFCKSADGAWKEYTGNPMSKVQEESKGAVPPPRPKSKRYQRIKTNIESDKRHIQSLQPSVNTSLHERVLKTENSINRSRLPLGDIEEYKISHYGNLD